MPQPQTLRLAALWVWESLLNTPYRWGGDDPLDGVDCSGFVLEGLKSVGLVPREFDTTAAGLLTKYQGAKVEHARPGVLVFFGTPVTHVEVVWAVYPDRILTLGASGGGSRTVDRATAVVANAYVKVRRISLNPVGMVDPFLAVEPG